MSLATNNLRDAVPAGSAYPPMDLGQFSETGASSRFLPEFEVPTFDPHAILAAVLRNRWIVLAIILVALAVGLISTLLARPVYQATASVQIDQQIAKVLGTEDQDEFRVGGNEDRFLQTQVDVLRSRGLAEQVVDTLKLQNNDAFLAAIGIKVENLTKSRNDLHDGLIGAVQGMLAVDLPRSTRVARISINSADSSVAELVANAYVDAFISGNLQRKFDQSSYSRKFLSDQLEQTRLKLEKSERDMVDFARGAGLIEIGSSGNDGQSTGSQSLVTSDLVQLNDALAAAKGARIAAEQQWAQAQSTAVMSLPEVLTNGAVQALSQQLSQAKIDYAEMRQRFQPDYPAVQQKAAVIAALEKELGTKAAGVKNSIRDRFIVAQRQEASLEATVGGLKNATLAERDRSIRYNILKREVDTNRALYDALLQRYKEVSAEAGVTTNNISVVDRAQQPKMPIYPRPARTMMMALLLGVAAAGGFVYAREKLTDAVRTPDDVEARAGLPLLGVTPLLRQGLSPISSIEDPKSQFSEAIHAMRTSLELATSHGTPATLALTSARPSEGKSTLAYSLAREFALAGKKVVLIDANLRAPTMHRLFNVKNKNGLSQVLARQADMGSAIVGTAVEGLDLIPSGPLPPDPTLLLEGGRLNDVLTTLKTSYEMILIDCPPVLGLADALQVGSRVEGMLMIIEANDTRFANLRTALKRLRDSRVHLFGAVLSKFDAARFGYGEYYGYYYSHYGERDS